MSHGLGITLVLNLWLCQPSGLLAQFQPDSEPAYPAPSSAEFASASMVSWETDYFVLQQRLDELEQIVKEQDKSGAGSTAKPTQKWSGRVHLDYWPMGTSSPLANYLETGDPTDDPEDFMASAGCASVWRATSMTRWNTKWKWSGPPPESQQ